MNINISGAGGGWAMGSSSTMPITYFNTSGAMTFGGGAATLIQDYSAATTDQVVINQFGVITDWQDGDDWCSNQISQGPYGRAMLKVQRRKKKPPQKTKKPRRELLEWYCLDCRFLEQEVEVVNLERDWTATRTCENCEKKQRLIITTVKSRLFRFEGSPDVVRIAGQNDKPCAREIRVVILKKEIVDKIRKIPA